ncbi:uncharacterized protein LOC131217640 [Magnolia sinica]|uniref:uncharacterized protein LOC131217640 n=1 Tax=Magnolia sinica TaxID=86752 RepID=UPI00265A412A|nr:uncharacterized protein LOC131217640 [Magnolia sinica]
MPILDMPADKKVSHISVYGPTQDARRKDFWEELSSVKQSFVGPSCMVGDFNVTRFVDEKSHRNKITPAMAAFSRWIEDQELVDLPLLGSRFTWSNGRATPILSRLDRFLISPDWLDIFPSVFQLVEGYAGYRLFSKLKQLKDKLKQWKQKELRAREPETDSLLSELQRIDEEATVISMSTEMQTRSIQLIQYLSTRALEKEISWKQKSRAKWIKEGDRNTSYFHNIANMHARNNKISSIVVNGRRIEDKNSISEEAIIHFSSLLKGEGWRRPRLDHLQIDSISPEEAIQLEAPFNAEEVRKAIEALGNDRAPGPDGFP